MKKQTIYQALIVFLCSILVVLSSCTTTDSKATVKAKDTTTVVTNDINIDLPLSFETVEVGNNIYVSKITNNDKGKTIHLRYIGNNKILNSHYNIPTNTFSVIYTENSDTSALDFLHPMELDSLIFLLNNQ